MAGYSKEQPTPFDATTIDGLMFLNGDTLARWYRQDHLRNRKYPVITFPSGLVRELSDTPQDGGTVHIFSALHLPRHQSRDEAFVMAAQFAEEYDYMVAREGKNALMIANPHSGNGYRVRYDAQASHITNIERFPEHAMELLPGEVRAALPGLYSGEEQELNAIAPVKFFTPAGSWTWYASEYDGKDTFFGLVSGFEVELGYFQLTELESIRDPLGLPIERDLYYTPRTLGELQTFHLGG